jgi:hypothetical protein
LGSFARHSALRSSGFVHSARHTVERCINMDVQS